MKTKLLYVLIAGIVALALAACSADEDPAMRVRNDRGTKANLQIKTSGGSTININDVEPNQTTGYQNVSEGLIEATASIQNEPVSPATNFHASKNNKYTVVVAAGDPPTLRVE